MLLIPTKPTMVINRTICFPISLDVFEEDFGMTESSATETSPVEYLEFTENVCAKARLPKDNRSTIIRRIVTIIL
jgi:hypothetical protein